MSSTRTGQDLLESGFARTGRILYQAVKELNDRGDHFPLWTTCLGYELLFILESGTFNFTRCGEQDTCGGIGFVADYDRIREESKIFQGITDEFYQVSFVLPSAFLSGFEEHVLMSLSHNRR